MIYLAGFLSILVFGLATIIASIITRTIFLNIAGRFNISIVYQFIGEFFGSITGFYFGSLVFNGFDIEFKPLVFGLIYVAQWNLTNAKIAIEHHPIAQRLGSLIGVSIMTIIYL